MKKYLFICLIFIAFACESSLDHESVLIQKTDNLIVVLSNNWETPNVAIYLLTNSPKGFVASHPSVEGVIGKKGMGIGLGLHSPALFQMASTKNNSLPQKKEGDKKSPAGIFKIGRIMGFADSLPFLSELHYQQILSSTHAVDDVSSEYYNVIVDSNTFEPTYKQYYTSFENMSQMQAAYKWMFEILHNQARIPGAGSNIFFHIKNADGSGTGGCTAVSEQDLLRIMQFIDSNTLILQLPRNIYQSVYTDLKLPQLN